MWRLKLGYMSYGLPTSTKNNFLKSNKKQSSTPKGLKHSPVEPLAADAASAPKASAPKGGAPKGGNTRSVIVDGARRKPGRPRSVSNASIPNTPLGVNMDRTPSSEEVSNSDTIVVDTRSFDSILMLVEDPELEVRVQSAAQATKCQTRKVTGAFEVAIFPAFLAVVDPELLGEDGWDLMGELLRDRGPEGIKILLTRPCPYAACLPSYLAIPTPQRLDGDFLERLMRDLRKPLPSIAELAPFYPDLIARMPQRFSGFTFLDEVLKQHSPLFHTALAMQLEVRYPHIMLGGMPRGDDDPNAALWDRCTQTVTRLLCRQLHDFPHLVAPDPSQELGPEVWPDEERYREWTKLSR